MVIEQHVLQLESRLAAQKAEHLKNLSRENVAKTAAEYFMLGNSDDDRSYKRAIIKLALSKGYIDDIITEAHKTEEGRLMLQKMAEISQKAGRPFQEGVDYKITKVPALGKDGRPEEDSEGNPVYLTGEDGKVIQVQAMEYNDNTRRALYIAMFGVNAEGELNDQAAGQLLAEEGEKDGLETKHLEYMNDGYFDIQTGRFKLFDLKKKTKNVEGKQVVVWISAGEKKAAHEISKQSSRSQAGVAWHSLMSSDGHTIYREIFFKLAKSFVENPTYMQERTCNMLIAGTTDEHVLAPIREHFINTGELLLDPVSAARVNEILEIFPDKKVLNTILARFINNANPAGVERIAAQGFKIVAKK